MCFFLSGPNKVWLFFFLSSLFNSAFTTGLSKSTEWDISCPEHSEVSQLGFFKCSSVCTKLFSRHVSCFICFTFWRFYCLQISFMENSCKMFIKLGFHLKAIGTSCVVQNIRTSFSWKIPLEIFNFSVKHPYFLICVHPPKHSFLNYADKTNSAVHCFIKPASIKQRETLFKAKYHQKKKSLTY